MSLRRYTVMGDIVNLSARLMVAAADYAPEQGVLVDAATFSALRMHYDFDETLPEISVKGKEDLVRAYVKPPLVLLLLLSFPPSPWFLFGRSSVHDRELMAVCVWFTTNVSDKHWTDHIQASFVRETGDEA